MGKTFVEDERPCDSCVNATRYGCVSWNCEYINRDEAIKAWREKHETADRKTEPICESCSKNPCKKKKMINDIGHWVSECTEFDRKTELQTDCGTCKWGEWYRKGYDITMMSDECGGCCSWNNKWKPKDEPQTDCSWK